MKSVSDLELMDYKYNPVKIIQYTNFENKLFPNRVFVFLGNQNDKIKKILDNISNQDYNKQTFFYISNTDTNILKEHFGQDWINKCGLSLYNISNKKSNVTSSKREKKTVKKKKIKDKKKSEKDIMTIDTEDLFNDSELSESENLVLSENIEDSDSDIDLDSRDFSKKIIFIYNYIYNDDKIEDIKKKIEITTQIPTLYQHLWIENKNYIQTLGYFFKQKYPEQMYDININNIFDFKKILDTPIDKLFTKKYIREDIILKNENRKILNDVIKHGNLTDYNNEIKFINFMDFYTKIDKKILKHIINNDTNTFNLYNIGFVKKFWPFIKNFKTQYKNEIKIDNFANSLYKKQIENENYQIRLIESISKKKIDLKIQQTSILQITLHINYNVINYQMKNIINLRNLFDFYETTELIPFIKYKNYIDDTLDTKTYMNNFYDDIIYKWSDKIPHGISFRMRLSSDKKNLDYKKFAIINMFPDGKIECKLIWEENDNATYNNILSSIRELKKFISSINELGNKVFTSYIRLPELKYKNMNVAYINTITQFNLKKTKIIDYNQLSSLAKTFNSYITLDTKIKSENLINFIGKYNRISPKKISEDVKYIFSYISKLKKDNLNDEEIVSKIKELGKTVEEAELIIEDYYLTILKIKIKDQKIKIPGIEVKVTGQEIPKLHITGSTSFCQLLYIYNFFIRMLFIYDNMDELFKKEEYQELKKNLKKNIVEKKKEKKKINKEISRNKKLKIVDPKLFTPSDLLPNKKKMVYSRLCQQRRQPDILTKAEFKKKYPNLKDEKIIKLDNDRYTTPYTNYTDTDEKSYFICEDKIYPYLGFLTSEKHPNNYCLPCCNKKSSLDSKDKKNFQTFEKCITGAIDSDNVILINYFKQADKDLEYKRWGKLPATLDMIFNHWVKNNQKCSINKNNKLDKNSECFSRLGIIQNNMSFLNAITMSLGLEKKEKEVNNYNNTIIRYLIDYLDKHPKIIDILENSKIKIKFKTIDNYKQYIQNKNIDHNLVWQLLTLPNVIKNYPSGINIIIFKLNTENKIEILCSNNNYLDKFINDDKPSLVLIQYSENIFYPIYKIINDNNIYYYQKLANPINNKSKAYNDKFYNSEIITLIKKLYRKSCLPKIIRESFLLRTGYELNYTLSQFLKLDLQDFKIAKQYIDKEFNVTYLVISYKDNNEFSIPIKPSSPITELKTTSKIIYGEYNIILKFLDKIKKLIDYDILKYILDEKQEYILGFLLNNGYNLYIQKIKISKLKLKLTKDKIIIQYYDYKELENIIKSDEVVIDDRIKHLQTIKYDSEIYKLFQIEISKWINGELNTKYRKILNKMMELDTKKIKSFKKVFLNNICKCDKECSNECQELRNLITKEDNHILKNIFYSSLSYDDKKQTIKNLSFTFDFLLRHTIEKQIKENNFEELEKIIRKISDNIIKISNKEKKIDTSSNIRDVCHTSKEKNCKELPQCYFSSSGECKLILDKKNKENFIEKITHEILKNEIIRNKILYDKVDKIIDKTKYKQRKSEVICKIPTEKIEFSKTTKEMLDQYCNVKNV